MIRINVTITVTPEKKEKLLALLQEMGVCSRQERGCIGYEIYQNCRLPEEVVIVETWKNEDCLAVHENSAHFVRIIPLAKNLADEWLSLKFEQ